MQLTPDTATATVTRGAALTAGPLMPHPYAPGKQMALVRLTVTYELKNDQWQVKPGGIGYVGALLKADGTPGKKTLSNTPNYGWQRDPQWAFLHQAIEVLRPTGRIHLPDGTHTHIPAGSFEAQGVDTRSKATTEK